MIRDYVALDLETSGLNPSENQIIEIGMAKVCDGEITETYSRLLNPKEKLSQRIVELTGITDEMVAGQPHVSEVIDEIVSFIGDMPLLGHNIIFDYSFLKKACVNHGIPFEKNGIDTLKLARRLLPEVEHKNLDVLCAYFQINPGNSHRALDDAVSAHQLYYRLYDVKPDDEGFRETLPLNYTVRKDTPVTAAQKRYLAALVSYHGLTLEQDIDSLTKSRASKIIDGIISEHGKLPYKK